MKIVDGIVYVGVNDHKVDLFEGQFDVPRGMAYNSYFIDDEKTAVFDTVDAAFVEEWLGKVREAASGRKVDFLVVQHMESDHSAGIAAFMDAYPEAKVVSSAKAFEMMAGFFGRDWAGRRIVVKEGDTLDTGRFSFMFVAAPMVHWPEVMVTYEKTTKTLFSADGFGKFGANDVEDPEGWDCEARRYYFGIVGKFGAQVQALLKKASGLEIARILPLHGPVLLTAEEVSHVVGQYDTWSSYRPESEGVAVFYTSVYGNTKAAVLRLVEMLKAEGCPKVSVFDLARDDRHEAIEDAFRYGKIVLATTTYNGDIFPYMRSFITALVERNYQNRTVGLVECGAWAPTAARVMKGMFEKSKDVVFCENTVTLRCAADERAYREMAALAKEIAG